LAKVIYVLENNTKLIQTHMSHDIHWVM